MPTRNPAMQNALIIQHVPFEGPAGLLPWLSQHHFDLEYCHLYRGDKLPDENMPDLVIVMGGPMGIYDEHEHPWLKAEKQFLQRSLQKGIKILGICLGAQLLADALGAQVHSGQPAEIGWFPVQPTNHSHPITGTFIQRPTVFHWHGDRFDIPEGCIHLLESQTCSPQAFIYQDQALGLQFHLETTEESAQLICQHCAHDLQTAEQMETIQGAGQITGVPPSHYQGLKSLLFEVMDLFYFGRSFKAR